MKSLRSTLKNTSPHIIHLGVALLFIGYGVSQTMTYESNGRVKVGETIDIDEYTIKLIKIDISEDIGDKTSREYWDNWEVSLEVYEGDVFLEEGKMGMVYAYNPNKDLREWALSLPTYDGNNLNIGPVHSYVLDEFHKAGVDLSDDAMVTFPEPGENFLKYFYHAATETEPEKWDEHKIENFVKIVDGDRTFIVENMGTHLNVYGRREFSSIMKSDIYVHQMLVEDLYVSFHGIMDNKIRITAKTIPGMNALWAGMILFVLGITIRTLVDYFPTKRKEAWKPPRTQEKKRIATPPVKTSTTEIDNDYEKMLEKELKRFRS